MKTFDEALQFRLVRRTPKEAQEAAIDVEGRYGSLFEEIANNPRARRIIWSIATAPPPPDAGLTEDDWFMSIIVSIFCNGVMVGIEMEKSE